MVIRDFDNPDEMEVIYEPKKSDIAGLLVHPLEYVPLVVMENYRRPERIFLDATIEKDYKFLQALDPSAYVVLVDYSEDYRKWLVAQTFDNKPAEYYFYDRDLKKVTWLFTTRPALKDYRLTKMNSVVVETRDGLSQVCYLSLPLEDDPLGKISWLKIGSSALVSPGV